MRQSYHRFHVVVMADYNDDDAHGIVQDNLTYWFDQHDLQILSYDRVDVAPFNTVETGYMLARRALNPLSPSARQVFFVNTAPRMDDPGARRTNQGEGFVRAELRNGKQVFAVSSGHTLSFVKPEIRRLNRLNVPDSADDIPLLVEALRAAHAAAGGAGQIGAGQFRSGYIYPIVVARALGGDDAPLAPPFEALTGPELDPAAIPDLPDDRVAFRDGYGNFKTSIRPEALAGHFDELAVVACQGAEIVAHVKPAIFDVPLHHFSLALGSTILAYSDGSRRQFVELVLRGGHAAKAFPEPMAPGETAYPTAGAAIAWRRATPTTSPASASPPTAARPEGLLRSASRVG
ncbi:MAG TPA: hypothetical protein VFY87_15845 [Geminicoccaceae bacterium]|nr:hypothetical protein [Geminicoccaceae bacterium]